MSGYVYIVFDKLDENLIIGITWNLLMHMHEIKNKINDIYKNEFSTNKLAYYENYDDISEAIIRKKELDNLKKEDLISMIKLNNPNWNDLHSTILKIWNDAANLHEKTKIIKHKGENIWKPLHWKKLHKSQVVC